MLDPGRRGGQKKRDSFLNFFAPLPVVHRRKIVVGWKMEHNHRHRSWVGTQPQQQEP